MFILFYATIFILSSNICCYFHSSFTKCFIEFFFRYTVHTRYLQKNVRIVLCAVLKQNALIYSAGVMMVPIPFIYMLKWMFTIINIIWVMVDVWCSIIFSTSRYIRVIGRFIFCSKKKKLSKRDSLYLNFYVKHFFFSFEIFDCWDIYNILS